MKVFGLMAALTAVLVGEARADERQVPTIQITGQSTVKATPDEGYITVGVVTKADMSSEALENNTIKMRAMFKALDAKGVTKDNYQTNDFTLERNFKIVHGENNQQKRIEDGFLCTNTVRVTVCELNKFGEILDTLVSSGANSIHSIDFGSSKSKEKTAEARKAAVTEAKTKATAIADALGVRLGRVKLVTESSFQPRQQMYSTTRMADTSEVPISGGSVSFSATVNITWEVVEGEGKILPFKTVPVDGVDPVPPPDKLKKKEGFVPS